MRTVVNMMVRIKGATGENDGDYKVVRYMTDDQRSEICFSGISSLPRLRARKFCWPYQWLPKSEENRTEGGQHAE